jgi:hypothetical protein
MKKTLILAAALLATAAIVKAQAPAIQWQKTLGGSGIETTGSIKQTSDHGYILCGSATSNDGDVTGHHGLTAPIQDNLDYWIVKLDSNHAIQWQKSLGGIAGDQAKNVEQTADGGYIVSGESESIDGDVTGNHGSRDYWIVKLNASGNIQWQKSYGGTSDDFNPSIKQTTDGGYVIAGSSLSNDGDVTGHNTGGYGADYWVIKVDTSGNIQWQKSYGGNSDDQAYDVKQTSDGGYILSGTSNSTDGDVTGNHGGYDYWVVKIKANGNIQWQKSYGGSEWDLFPAIQQTKDGGYVLAGSTTSSDGQVTGNHSKYSDYWVVKIKANGKLVWEKSFGGTKFEGSQGGNIAEGGCQIEQTQNGEYIVSGTSFSKNGDVTGHNGNTSTSDLWLVKLDTTGNLKWQKSLGGSNNEGVEDYGVCIQQTKDGGYVAFCSTNSIDGDVTGTHLNKKGNPTGDYWVVKLAGDSTNVSSQQNRIATGLANQTLEVANNFIVYPNPSTGAINILFNDASMQSFVITNMLGQSVVNSDVTSSIHTVDLSSQPKGIYFVTVKTNTTTLVKKVTLQ